MVTFQIPGMTCGGCARAITNAVHDLDPKARIDADVIKREIKVASTVAADEIVRALANAGYPAAARS